MSIAAFGFGRIRVGGGVDGARAGSLHVSSAVVGICAGSGVVELGPVMERTVRVRSWWVCSVVFADYMARCYLASCGTFSHTMDCKLELVPQCCTS